ncbi:MAG: flagellar motor protein [Dehalococcoidia bacterium]|nr:flagellar motor protein [Dehalococcoidia bacterium]
MKQSSLIGLILALAALIVSLMVEGGDIGAFASMTAALIVFGGTIGATLTSYPMGTVKKLPKLIKLALLGASTAVAPRDVIGMFVGLAERARREGLLSLEEEAGKITDAYIRKGMLLVVDGIDPEVIRTVLDVDVQAMSERHQKSYAMLESMGGYAPTMGIIGTVMGLVNVLSNLQDAAALGPAIAVAFIATLYGVASANLLWLPVGNKLKSMSKEEVWMREVAREGILAVQAGDNPRIVREKLEPFLAVSDRGVKASKEAAKSPGEPAPSEAVAAAGAG